ncbi:MAG: hypothetical protein M1817_004795 [Caeruleum heppii]|nr:MAG: hypothetical protein M1817_004795 [Caeruleum heppii]
MSTLPAGDVSRASPHSRPPSPSIVKWLENVPDVEESKLQQPLQGPSPQNYPSNSGLCDESVEIDPTWIVSTGTPLADDEIQEQGFSSSPTDLDMSLSYPRSTSTSSQTTTQGLLTPASLRVCQPSIRFFTYDDAKQEFSVPKAAVDLYEAMEHTRAECKLPLEFKVRTSKARSKYDQNIANVINIKDRYHQPVNSSQLVFDTEPYSEPKDLQLLWDTLKLVRQSADRLRLSSSENELCNNVVRPTLLAMTRLESMQDRIAERDLRACGIEPKSLCPLQASRATPHPKPLDRKIDFGLVLVLSREEQSSVAQYLFGLPQERQSLCQSKIIDGFDLPILELEIKPEAAALDARVQMGVWAAAWFAKCHQEGWSTANLARPMIGVRQDSWYLYVTFEAATEADGESSVIVMGPIGMGRTLYDGEAYCVLKIMAQLCEWGETTYRAWLRSVVLGLPPAT